MKDSIVNRLVEFSQRHPLYVVLITAAITAVLGTFALRIQIDPEIAGLLPKKAEVMRLTEEFGANARNGYLAVAVESEELFTIHKLKAFYEAISRIEARPEVLGSINPFNLITFQKEGKKLKLVPMSTGRRAPESIDELERFREKLTMDPLARNLVISNDLSSICSVFSIEVLDDYSDLLASIESILVDLEPYYKIHLAGHAVITETVKRYLRQDVPKFLIFGIIVILIVFFISFRSRRSIILPFIVVALGTLWTIGVMSILAFKLTLVSIMVPLLVLTIGSSYSIHILNQYYREAKVHSEDRQWISSSVSHINKTILMASLTTIIGFMSLIFASLHQVKEFGISTSIGIAFCAFLSLFFLPAVLSKLKTPTSLERDRVLKGYIAGFMEKISRGVIKWRFLILIILIIIVATFVLSARYIKYQTNYMSYFRRQEKAVDDHLFVVKKFGGFVFVYISITAPEGENNYFFNPEFLRQISTFEDELKKEPDVAYLSSFTSYLKLMNLTMSGDFTIPEKRAPVLLLSRYFKSISSTPAGKTITGRLVNEDFTRLTIALRVYNGEKETVINEVELSKLIKRIEEKIDRCLGTEIIPVIWGDSLDYLYFSEILSKDQLLSVLVSVLLIFLFTAIFFRSFKIGLYTLIPMLTGIMLNFILMTLFDIPFDIVTVMFSSVAIGVGIDDSIHLIIQYRRQSRIFHDDKQKIIAHTLKIAGRPILLTSISLVAGLLVLAFSSFMPIVYFGILVSLALFSTTLGALIILPAILSL